MKYTSEPAEKSTVKVTIKFSAKEWNEAIDKAYLKTKGKYAVNGFRKGKVPKHVLENFYGKGIFYEDALNELYTSNFGKILEKEKDNFVSVGEPSLSVEDLTEEKGVTLLAVIPVKPDVTIESYKGIKIKEYVYNVKDEEVEAEVKKLQERNARKVDVTERACQNGDIVNINFSGSINGKKFEGGTADNFDLTLGSGQFIPGFEDQVAGMSIGEEKDVVVSFPADYQATELAGKEAVFAVKLNSIKVKELPEVNDEFVKDAAGVETVEEYKEKAKKRLEEAVKKKSDDATENSIIAAISEKTTVEIPQTMIEQQIDSMMQNLEYQLMYQGLNLDGYVKYLGTTKEELRKQYAEQAKKNVLSQLVIEKIVKTEGFGATEAEIDEKIAEQAKSVEKTFEEYKKTMDPKQHAYIENDIILCKMFKFLKENNEMEVEE